MKNIWNVLGVLFVLGLVVKMCESKDPITYCDCYDEYVKWEKEMQRLTSGRNNPYEDDVELNKSLADACEKTYKKDNGIKSERHSPQVLDLLNYFKKKCVEIKEDNKKEKPKKSSNSELYYKLMSYVHSTKRLIRMGGKTGKVKNRNVDWNWDNQYDDITIKYSALSQSAVEKGRVFDMELIDNKCGYSDCEGYFNFSLKGRWDVSVYDKYMSSTGRVLNIAFSKTEPTIHIYVFGPENRWNHRCAFELETKFEEYLNKLVEIGFLPSSYLIEEQKKQEKIKKDRQEKREKEKQAFKAEKKLWIKKKILRNTFIKQKPSMVSESVNDLKIGDIVLIKPSIEDKSKNYVRARINFNEKSGWLRKSFIENDKNLSNTKSDKNQKKLSKVKSDKKISWQKVRVNYNTRILEKPDLLSKELKRVEVGQIINVNFDLQKGKFISVKTDNSTIGWIKRSFVENIK